MRSMERVYALFVEQSIPLLTCLELLESIVLHQVDVHGGQLSHVLGVAIMLRDSFRGYVRVFARQTRFLLSSSLS